MDEKAYITSDNTAIFACAACNRQHIVDVSKYLDLPEKTRMRLTCKCGHSWTTMLEKRRHYRKDVSFPGRYIFRTEGKPTFEGNMTVVDISRRGLKVTLHDKRDFQAGDWLEVEFRLDNKPRTLVKRMTIIKSAFGLKLGLAFPEHKHEDPDIGFYMLSATGGIGKDKKTPGKSKK
jgi:PilZ domain-containing protein